MKRAQMEIMGLAIVIVLITLVGLFAVKFYINREPSETRKTFVQSELASAFLSTLLKTSSTCHKTTFEELLQDCASGEALTCEDKSSCRYANDKIRHILAETLDERTKGYQFRVKTPDPSNEMKIPSDPHPCPASYRSKSVPISLGMDFRQTIIITLDICD